MNLQEIKQELLKIEDMQNELNIELKSLFLKAASQVCEKQNCTRLASNAIIVQSSQFFGNPWNYEYHDWRAGFNVLFDALNKKPPIEWFSFLMELLDNKPDSREPIKIRYRYPSTNNPVTVPISRKFVKSIIENL